MKPIICRFQMALGIVVLSLTTWSCGKRTTPEEEVQNFGRSFIEMVNSNQLDSLKESYPDIVLADSLIQFKSDSVRVESAGINGRYNAMFSDSIILVLEMDERGKIKVSESKGLFSFPKEKIDIAKKTGMWETSLNDVQLSKRMKDEDFFKIINDKLIFRPEDIIEVADMVITKMWEGASEPGEGYFLLTNKTRTPISGKEYDILMTGENTLQEYKWNYTEPGLDLEPYGSVKMNVKFHPNHDPSFKGIKFKLNDEELKAKFISFNGNEYKEYLNSKSGNINTSDNIQPKDTSSKPFEGKFIDNRVVSANMPKGFLWSLHLNLYNKSISVFDCSGKTKNNKGYGYFKYKGDAEQYIWNIIEVRSLDANSASILIESACNEEDKKWITITFNPKNKTMIFTDFEKNTNEKITMIKD